MFRAEINQLKRNHEEVLQRSEKAHEAAVSHEQLAQKLELDALYLSDRNREDVLRQLRKDHGIAMRLLKEHHNIEDLSQIKDIESRVRAHSDEISALNSGKSKRADSFHLKQKQSANATQFTPPQ